MPEKQKTSNGKQGQLIVVAGSMVGLLALCNVMTSLDREAHAARKAMLQAQAASAGSLCTPTPSVQTVSDNAGPSHSPIAQSATSCVARTRAS